MKVPDLKTGHLASAIARTGAVDKDAEVVRLLDSGGMYPADGMSGRCAKLEVIDDASSQLPQVRGQGGDVSRIDYVS